MDRIPKWAQAVILLAVIAASGGLLYYNFVVRSPERVRRMMRERWDSNVAAANLKELQEKGRQKAGDYTVEATRDKANDYVNVTIRKTTADGKVVEEIKAPRMTVTNANEMQFLVAVFDATFTTYDETGNPKTSSVPGRKDVTLYEVRAPSGP